MIAGPRNHEYYTVKKPFAGAEELGPGKGLRAVCARVDVDLLYVAVQQLPSAYAAFLERRPEIVQIRRDAGGMDLQERLLNACLDVREGTLEPGLFRLGLREPRPHLGRRVAGDDELPERDKLLPHCLELIAKVPALGLGHGGLRPQPNVHFVNEPTAAAEYSFSRSTVAI